MRIDEKTIKNKLARYAAAFYDAPRMIPSTKITDAPLLGNGDVGVAIGGGCDEQTFHIGKNDFWIQAHLGETREQRIDRLLTPYEGYSAYIGPRIVTAGHIRIEIPELKSCSYFNEQDIYHAEVRGDFKDTRLGIHVAFCSWLQSGKNIMFNEIVNSGRNQVTVKIHHFNGTRGREQYGGEIGYAEDASWFVGLSNPTNVEGRKIIAVYTKITGQGLAFGDCHISDSHRDFILEPGKKILLVTSVSSDADARENGLKPRKFAFKTAEMIEFSKKYVSSYGLDNLDSVKTEHRKWWSDFWAESFIDINDYLLEKYYYGSQYILACCMRGGKAAPGLFGNWITTDTPEWTGSYTVNYNYQAPFWGLYSSNHIGISDCYHPALLDSMEICHIFAKELLGCRGIYAPVELGPGGIICANIFWSQKSNAAFLCLNLLMRFFSTYDMDYAGTVYPYIKATAEFWEDYLVFEDGRYVIYHDAALESFSTEDVNNLLSLALVRALFHGILEISRELGVDGDLHEKWRHILTHISGFAVYERDGAKVFKAAEKGLEWTDCHVGVWNIFPTGQIGIGSDPSLLETGINTFEALGIWDNGNGFSSYYAAGARLGYHPETLLDKLREQCLLRGLPNLFIEHEGGGIENCSGIPGSINEMLFQSHEGILRFFPVWPENVPARFVGLRGYGAFLAASEYRDGSVLYIRIESEKGRECVVQNPWPGEKVKLLRDGEMHKILMGEILTFETAPGETLELHRAPPH